MSILWLANSLKDKFEKFKGSKAAKVAALVVLLGVILFVLKGCQPDTSKATTDDKQEDSPKESIETTTGISAGFKESSTDPDVVLEQTYTAVVNGQTITVPIKTLPSTVDKSESPTGSSIGASKASPKQEVQGTIKQQIDLSPVIDAAVKANEKPWSLGVGAGVEQGNFYVPIELRKDLSKETAASVEIHLKPKDSFRVSGGELKYIYRF